MKSLALVLLSAVNVTAMAGMPSGDPQHALTFVVLGDAGNRGGILRGNASLVDAMMTGENDGGVPSALIFLGSDFGETGLNVPSSEVDGEVNATLGFFKSSLQRLGRDNVHGIPGETEYFSQKAIETTALFGLIALSKWPVGVSDRGVLRAGSGTAPGPHFDQRPKIHQNRQLLGRGQQRQRHQHQPHRALPQRSIVKHAHSACTMRIGGRIFRL